ncbi:complex I subunit 5 family protein [Peptoclostridium litorale]|nr:proton-conducting transporter membrane subunit [Peptoclostridium litorale]
MPIALPLISSLLILSRRFESERLMRIIAGVTVIFNMAVVILILAVDFPKSIEILKLNEYISIFLKIDRLGSLFAVLASSLWILTAFYSMEYMEHEKDSRGFFAFFTATLGVIVGIAFSGNLVTLYLFYEVLTLFTYPLVIHSRSEEAFRSGRKYLVYSFGGAALIVLGMVILYSIAPNMQFAPASLEYSASEKNMLLYSFMLMFLGFGVKAAVVPFHSWLPSAMVAPTPVSSLLHAVAVVKSGVFSIIRVAYFVFGANALKDINGHFYAGAFACVTILMGSFLALTHDNLKKRLAYSTISQLGYILLGVFALNEKALWGGLLHFVNHALIKIVLFFCAGAIYVKLHKKNISELRGVGRKMPVTMTCFAIAAISLIGIPPTNGFMSKWYIAIGSLEAGRAWFAVTLLVSAVLTAAYLMPIITKAFFYQCKEDNGSMEMEKEAGFKMLVPIVVITAIIIANGIFPSITLDFIEGLTSEISF